jgi:hypothetical protein
VDRVVLWRRGRRPRRAGQLRDSVFVFSDARTTSRLIGEEAALARAMTPAQASGGGDERGRWGRAGQLHRREWEVGGEKGMFFILAFLIIIRVNYFLRNEKFFFKSITTYKGVASI